MNPSSSPKPPRLLFVCLGNICRSPTAHGVSETLAARNGLDVEIESAGTAAWHIGNPPDRRMQAAARAAGYDLSALCAQEFTAADFDRFDLILAMDRANLAEIERQRPSGSDTPVRLFLDYGNTETEEVPDPYYEGGFDAVVAMVEQTAERLLNRIVDGRVLPRSEHKPPMP